MSPKINSLIDCFEEMDLAFGVVTETWLSDGAELEEDLVDFVVGAGLGKLTRNREKDHRGVSYGGTAIVSHLNKCTFKMVELNNPDGFEVLAASGRFAGYSREVVVLACYLPPNLPPNRVARCL